MGASNEILQDMARTSQSQVAQSAGVQTDVQQTGEHGAQQQTGASVVKPKDDNIQR